MDNKTNEPLAPPPALTPIHGRIRHNGSARKCACAAEEVALLEALKAADKAEYRGKEEALCDTWFALLKEALEEPAKEPDPPAFTPGYA